MVPIQGSGLYGEQQYGTGLPYFGYQAGPGGYEQVGDIAGIGQFFAPTFGVDPTQFYGQLTPDPTPPPVPTPATYIYREYEDCEDSTTKQIFRLV